MHSPAQPAKLSYIDGAVIARVPLINKRGLHARASAKFISCAVTYDAHITVTSHSDHAETVVADSIMELLMLGSACGEDITICATGVEAQAAVQSLCALIHERFGEDE